MNGNLRQLVSTLEAMPAEEQSVFVAHFLKAIAEQWTAEDARWDQTFASPESQLLLEKLADHALSDHAQGKTRPLSELLAKYRHA